MLFISYLIIDITTLCNFHNLFCHHKAVSVLLSKTKHGSSQHHVSISSCRMWKHLLSNH